MSSKHIYLAHHVRFHENVFPLDNSEQIAVLPTQPFATTIPVTLHPLTPPSQVLSPLPPTHPSTPLPLTAYYYHDHSSGAGFDSPHSYASFIAPASSPGFSPASSPVVAIPPVVSPAGSPSRPAHILSSSPLSSSSNSSHGINLCVDLSKFHLQQVPTSISSTSSQMVRTYHMVLRPRPAKNANFSIAPASWVV